jgi:hypothetical protein
MSNGLAAVLHGIQERGRRDMVKEEQNYQRQRNARMDNIAERRMSLEERRAQRLLDSETAPGGKAEKPLIALKDARSLAIEQAKLQAPKDEYGNVQSIDPDLVEELTDYIMKYGTVPARRSKKPEGAVGTSVVEDTGGTEDAEPGVVGKWWDGATKSVGEAVGNLLGYGELNEAEAPNGNRPVDTSDPNLAADEFSLVGSGNPTAKPGERLGDRWSAINTISDYLGLGDGKKTTDQGAQNVPPIDPNTPDPDPEYLDVLEKIGATDQKKLVKILRELKARSPSEYAAVERKFRERRASKQPVK